MALRWKARRRLSGRWSAILPDARRARPRVRDKCREPSALPGSAVLPLDDTTSMIGKLGVHYWQPDAGTLSIDGARLANPGIVYGVGVKTQISKDRAVTGPDRALSEQRRLRKHPQRQRCDGGRERRVLDSLSRQGSWPQPGAQVGLDLGQIGCSPM